METKNNPLNYKIIQGDLLSSNEDYIVQQNNCISKKSLGLAKTIADRFPIADHYLNRTQNDTPGTIKIYDTNGKSKFKIICAFGQFYPGPCRQNCDYDTYEKRKKWFKECLNNIIQEIGTKDKNAKITIGFPHGIGCGLAGGKWIDYEKMLIEFAKENPNILVNIYNYN